MIDWANPQNPVAAGRLAIGPLNRVAATVGYVFATRSNGPFLVIDVSDPASPKLEFEDEITWWGAQDLALAGNRAYVLGSRPLDYRVVVWDITHPVSPRRVGQFSAFGFLNAISVKEGLPILIDSIGTLSIFPSVVGEAITYRVSGLASGPLTVERASELGGTPAWSPWITTNPPVRPWHFRAQPSVSGGPSQEYYRVRQ
jgi:hypothetical protein